MKRIFDAEKAADMLVNEYVSKSGIKLAKLYNRAIYNFFLPSTQALSLEANYILAKAEDGTLDDFAIKQSLSRGITWLSSYPIKDCSILREILLRFTFAPYADLQHDPRNDYVKSLFAQAEEKIKEHDPDYAPIHPCIANYGTDICDHWNTVWEYKIMYSVLSCIVYLCDIQKPISWYDAIMFLKDMENEAINEHGVR